MSAEFAVSNTKAEVERVLKRSVHTKVCVEDKACCGGLVLLHGTGLPCFAAVEGIEVV
jgi:hypothetical protein